MTDPTGAVRLSKADSMCSVPEGTDPEAFAREWLDAPDNAGWTCRVWIQDAVLPFPASREPDAVVTA
ncbi:hypothetical protein [Paractinoplanes deccanensis]|uniref:hypothetical protein n=1 Tax=Paractinoplanes deccanensis TaxID=113561 RepID=UPI001940676D|nr:hypothetical protein [Actinoplanes deccanensis]